ncbi:NAD(P)-binding protein [Glonium stellatum]|uniref:NAD(P)-binding protein n=1 Tax=Glonium stellatum TaxID=574774 RepID=A0A8E2JLU3_9PEZI|nr:NAD(P)-binding protein [Glonium stellatum]
MSPKRVLLTGAYGFIGSHILDQLLSFNISVRAVVGSEVEREALRNQFPRTTEAELDFAIVPDADLLAPRAYDDALIATPQPFDTVIHTVCAGLSEQDSFSHFVNLQSDSKKSFLESVRAFAPRVRRVIITNTLTLFARWLQSSELESQARFNTSSLQSAAASDPEFLLATCHASDDTVNDRLWKYIDDERPGFDLVALSAPSVYGPSTRHPRKITDLEEGNQMVWSICNAASNQRTVFPSDGISYYADVRDFAFAHVQAAFIPEAGNRRFTIAAGVMSLQIVSGILRMRFPELEARLPPEGSQGKVATSGKLSKDLVDSAPASAILGLIKYITIEETLVDVARQLLALEQTLRGAGSGAG